MSSFNISIFFLYIDDPRVSNAHLNFFCLYWKTHISLSGSYISGSSFSRYSTISGCLTIYILLSLQKESREEHNIPQLHLYVRYVTVHGEIQFAFIPVCMWTSPRNVQQNTPCLVTEYLVCCSVNMCLHLKNWHLILNNFHVKADLFNAKDIWMVVFI
jgi:hypothetical protein